MYGATGVNTVTNLPLKPFMKKGGYVFDANNAYWYRISNVLDPDPQNAAPGSARLILDTPANASNVGLTTAAGKSVPSRGMFPRGVVDVYSLGPKSYH